MLPAIMYRFSRNSNRKLLRGPALPGVMLAAQAAFVLACLATGPASAGTSTYWWDAGANPANWSTSDLNWSTSAAAGGSVVAWDTSGDYAIFSNSGYATASAGTADLTLSTTALGINFATGSTTIAATYAPGSGSMTVSGNITTGGTLAVTGPTTFDSSLGTVGFIGNSNWTNASGHSFVVNSALAPAAGQVAGTSNLFLPSGQGNQLTNPYTFIFTGVLSDNGTRKLFLNTQVTSGNVNSPYYTELAAANTFTGGSIIGGSGAGGFAITNSAALGTGQINLNGGCLEPLNNPITLTNPIIITTSNNWINGNQPLTISSGSLVSQGVYSSTEELGINDSGLVTIACPLYWNNSNTVGNVSKQPTISGSGSITITGNIYNNNAGNTQAMNWAYNGTGICTVTGTNNQNSGGVILSGAGVLQTSQTGGFGTALDLAGSNDPSTAPANVLTMSAGTLGLLNDLSVTFGTGGTGTANGYTFNQTGNAAIKVDNLTYPGSGPPDSTTGQTLTMGSGTMGTNNVLTFVNGHGYSLSIGTMTIMAGSSNSAHNVFFNNNMTNGTTSIDGMVATYTGVFANTIAFGGTSPSAVTIVGPITQLSTANSLGVTGSGSGLVVLTGSNTYNGPTIVTAGTLALGQIVGVGATLQSTSPVTVSGVGAFAVTPGTTTTSNNSIAGPLNLAANGAFSMADGYANTFNVAGSAALAPATGLPTSLTFDVGGGTTDVLAITGAASVGAAGAGIRIQGFGSASSIAGTYTLITAASGLGSNFTLPGGGVLSYGGSSYNETLIGNATSETLQLVAGPPAYATLYYNGAAGQTVLNATSGSNGNFSIDSAGGVNSGAARRDNQSLFLGDEPAGRNANHHFARSELQPREHQLHRHVAGGHDRRCRQHLDGGWKHHEFRLEKPDAECADHTQRGCDRQQQRGRHLDAWRQPHRHERALLLGQRSDGCLGARLCALRQCNDL